eukprot:CAMPEP_0169400366 /NCGR_PEP_ID=MMETSP1017-20121227/53798_1 /TAXON_ID=342587 /ORGANISM="Karlodinium micrum, Strain CCMP2283" /LENGTH=38 /DNA_ID= /DNA_START= /DNA_END= /DNA_ORIENTATION=
MHSVVYLLFGLAAASGAREWEIANIARNAKGEISDAEL